MRPAAPTVRALRRLGVRRPRWFDSRPAADPEPVDPVGFAARELGLESFASIDLQPVFGAEAFRAIALPGVERGVLANGRLTRPRDQIVNAVELAAETPGMRVVDGDFIDPTTIEEIGEVDAVLLSNVLLHMVAPDWWQTLELYAPSTRAFVISNPQWVGSEHTVRLPELEAEELERALPSSPRNREMATRLDEWYIAQQRPMRDSRIIWQWGITDAELEARLARLGFDLVKRQERGPVPGTRAFARRDFVFARSAD